jgi:hypothetical protein
MEPTPFMKVSQTRFEQMVRDLYETTGAGEWILTPVQTAVLLTTICIVLGNQPELLEGKRLVHNLGAEKIRFLREVHAQYKDLYEKQRSSHG